MADFAAPTEILASTDHISEPRLVRLASGDMLMLYRFDPGVEGNHWSHNGYLVVRRSTDNGSTFGDAITVIDTPDVDDRNHNIIQVSSGRIFCYFRRYNPDAATANCWYVYSDDDGDTWSDATQISTSMIASPSDVKYVIGRGWLLPMYMTGQYNEAWFTTDGMTFDKVSVVPPATCASLVLSEAAYEYLGGGVVYGVFRWESYPAYTGSGYYAAYSTDSGTTWTDPFKINVLSVWGGAPNLTRVNDTVYLISGDRQAGAHADSRLWICSLPIGDYANADGWMADDSFLRPEPSAYMFYGYATAAHVSGTDWMVLFTEASSDGTNEEADLYATTADLGSPYDLDVYLGQPYDLDVYLGQPYDLDVYLGTRRPRRRYGALDVFSPTML